MSTQVLARSTLPLGLCNLTATNRCTLMDREIFDDSFGPTIEVVYHLLKVVLGLLTIKDVKIA